MTGRHRSFDFDRKQFCSAIHHPDPPPVFGSWTLTRKRPVSSSKEDMAFGSGYRCLPSHLLFHTRGCLFGRRLTPASGTQDVFMAVAGGVGSCGCDHVRHNALKGQGAVEKGSRR